MSKEYPNLNNNDCDGIKDEELLLRSLDNPRLFERLVQKYQESFLRVSNRILNNKEESEDAVQDAFVKIYFHAKKFKKQEGIELKSWAYKILINTTLTRYRKLKRTRSDAEYNDALLSVQDSHCDADFARRKEQDLIESVFKQMPEELSSILRQHYLEDRPYAKISSQNGMSIAAIKMKLFRARKLFKEILGSME